MSARSRFVLLTIGELVLGAAAVMRSVELILHPAPPPMSRAPLIVLALGVILLSSGVVGIRALYTRHDPEATALIAKAVAGVDRSAPSGLKPLWVGIAIVLGLFLVWMVIAAFAPHSWGLTG